MTTKPLLLLAALTLCCCIASLHAAQAPRCKCIKTTYNPVKVRFIDKIEMIPISGNCRRTEIIITRKNGSKVCINPNAKWINGLLSDLQRMGCMTGRAPNCAGRRQLLS